MKRTFDPEIITISGGGNGAHALMALLSRNHNCHVKLYLPLESEFQRFQDTKDRGIPFKLTFKGGESEIPTEKLTITQNPQEAASADLMILVLPAFAHKSILDNLAPHLRPGTVLAAMPARGGFEFEASEVLRRNERQGVIIAGFQTLPWACRIREYAKSVEILGQKRKVGFAVFQPDDEGTDSLSYAQSFSNLLGIDFAAYNNMLELTLSNQGQIIHPGIMYGAFADRRDVVYHENEIPLFYQSVDEKTGNILEAMSGEILAVKEAIQDRFDVEMGGVISTSQWLLESYAEDIEDKSSLARMFQTNRSYRGLKVPARLLADRDAYKIDVKSRYLTEDVPYGLLVSKAIAELADVKTPIIDEIIEETSKWVGVQYLIDGKLGGRDLIGTRIPQNTGLNSIEEIIEMFVKSS